MYLNISERELEIYLSGEFAGRIYNIEKFMPVLNVLNEKGEISEHIIKRLIDALSACKNSYIYFNPKTGTLFGLNFHLSNPKVALSLDIIKVQRQSELELRKFCARLFTLIPLAQINIIDENEVVPGDKIAV